MKKIFKFILIFSIIIAIGYYGASFLRNKNVNQEFKAELTSTFAPVEIQMEDSSTLDVDKWINEIFPSGSIHGGKQPFKITSEGLPAGLKVKLDNRNIKLEGIPAETGKFNASISVIDSEGHSSLKNLTLTLKPFNLTLEQLTKERSDWLDKEKKPTYELIKTYEGFTLLMNWLLSNNIL